MPAYLQTISAIAISTAICCSAVSPASAQVSDAEALAAKLGVKQGGEQEADDRRIVEDQGPAGRSGYSPSDPTLQLLAESGKTEVSLGITLGSSTVHVDPNNPLRQRAQTTRFSFQGFAPVAKDGGDRFVNLAKPLSGSRLKIGLVHYFSNYTLDSRVVAEAARIMNLSLGSCIRQKINAWAADKPASAQQLAASYLATVGQRMVNGGSETEQVLNELNRGKDFADIPVDVKDWCRIGLVDGGIRNNEELIGRFGGGEPVLSSIRAVTAEAPTYFVGGDATFGRKSFSFLDRTAFATQEKGKGEYQLSVFAGIISGNGLWSLRGGVSHSVTYSAQDEIELCQPTSTPGQTQCLSGPDGAPNRTKRTAVTVEGRRLFDLPGTKARIGVAPEFSIDPGNGDYSIDMPIYFAPDKDGHLTGGIRFSYASEKKNLSFGVFVGVPFTVFQ